MIFTTTVESDFIEASKTLFWLFFQNDRQKLGKTSALKKKVLF
jgi:hypothetical protein